jgi:uncharacterized SAM-binding protein YcdF (DUF218 family)
VRRLLVVAGALLAVWLAVAIALFVVHHDDEPIRADAVVVLQGSDTRLPVGYRLVEEGYAPLLIVSRGSRLKLERRVCSGRTPVRAVCFQATSTRGEARTVAKLARERNLRRLDVVTSEFHVLRARIVFERCYDGELRLVGSANPTWRMPWILVTETAKLAYHLVVARDC